MAWQEQLNGDTLSWLLEEHELGVRYLALRDLLELPTDDVDLISARELAHTEGPISIILDQMDDAGYWVNAGPGYGPKYRSSVWSVILLAQLGASAALDKRIEKACQYLFEKCPFVRGRKFSMRCWATVNLCIAALALLSKNGLSYAVQPLISLMHT
jgi:hypothetical protein